MDISLAWHAVRAERNALMNLVALDPGFPRDDPPRDPPSRPPTSFPTDVPVPEPHDVPAPQPVDNPPPNPGKTPNRTKPPQRSEKDPQPRPVP
jgi:hypothetical protein